MQRGPESSWEGREVTGLDGVGIHVGLAAVVDQLVVDVELERDVVVLPIALK